MISPNLASALTQEPDSVLARFGTQCGATVELRTVRFVTQYAERGRPTLADRLREVDGFTWLCLGCLITGQASQSEAEYLPVEYERARDDANAHATGCRSRPQTEES